MLLSSSTICLNGNEKNFNFQKNKCSPSNDLYFLIFFDFQLIANSENGPGCAAVYFEGTINNIYSSIFFSCRVFNGNGGALYLLLSNTTLFYHCFAFNCAAYGGLKNDISNGLGQFFYIKYTQDSNYQFSFKTSSIIRCSSSYELFSFDELENQFSTFYLNIPGSLNPFFNLNITENYVSKSGSLGTFRNSKHTKFQYTLFHS
jgi:hypothetical protein